METEIVIAARLPFSFDVARLEADAHAVESSGWAPHFNKGYYEGDWSGIALRSNSRTSALYVDPSRPNDFADLPILDRTSYIREVLGSFQAPLRAVRFLKLAPGAVIREHRDFGLSHEDGEVRIHIPILTNADVEFILDDKPISLRAGECWYLNLDLRHRAANRGKTDRVHLVVDLVTNDWLDHLLRTECNSVI